ncbi:helix-turn-helix domain-containing protein [Gordonia sp. OPL2]|nr:helix-turn-helix domain-containing protein [Gordonia sp. OPL2]
MNRSFVSITEAADYVGVSSKSIRRYISDGRLRAYRTGPKLLRIRMADLDSMVTGDPVGVA